MESSLGRESGGSLSILPVFSERTHEYHAFLANSTRVTNYDLSEVRNAENWGPKAKRRELHVRDRLVSLTLMVLLLSAGPLFAQDAPVGATGTEVATEETPAAATNSEELRKAAQNPIASLISVPFQENLNFGIGPADRTQNVLNIQPVIPISLSKDWNLVTRWITPVIYQPLPVLQPPGPPVQQTGVYGLGDLNPSFFLSPKKAYHGVIWASGRLSYCRRRRIPRISGRGNSAWAPRRLRWCSLPIGQSAYLQTTTGLWPAIPMRISPP